jgi:hypothetical protein
MRSKRTACNQYFARQTSCENSQIRSVGFINVYLTDTTQNYILSTKFTANLHYQSLTECRCTVPKLRAKGHASRHDLLKIHSKYIICLHWIRLTFIQIFLCALFLAVPNKLLMIVDVVKDPLIVMWRVHVTDVVCNLQIIRHKTC